MKPHTGGHMFAKIMPVVTGAIFSGLLLASADLSAQLRSRSEVSTTDRMNTGGDSPYYPGLSGNQKGTYPINDWSGPSNFYYSNYGLRYNEGTSQSQGYGEPYYGKPLYQGPYGIGYKEYPDETYLRRNYPGYEAGRPY